jgi:hypothetical protein
MLIGILHIITSGVHWNEIKLGCKVLASNPQIHRTTNKLGFGVYLSFLALFGLFAFSLFTIVNICTLYYKSLGVGNIAGGYLYSL